MKTDWNFVIELLYLGVLSIFILYLGKYINMQSERIDELELKMMSITDNKNKPVGEVNWNKKKQ